MKAITDALKDKTAQNLEALKPPTNPAVGSVSNELTLTQTDVGEIVALMEQGKTDREVRKEWYRSGTKLSASYAQIKQIRQAGLDKLEELKSQQ